MKQIHPVVSFSGDLEKMRGSVKMNFTDACFDSIMTQSINVTVDADENANTCA
ncbi:hypothetical protein ACQQ2Q_08960 [Agrobacterium sp. ES01]|uniref:hypothetical protein n=1 Tax=Agrobacterium sp. ES01 TaxID=3420714 RepID=UPI003D11037E